MSCREKKELLCQGRLRALYLQLHQITGSELNQSQRGAQADREEGQKNGGLKSAAVSTGVIKTNSLGLSEEREGERKKQTPPFNLLPPLCLSY